ncbi:hypothetical protein BDV11DRAFT_28446 [Aspergillus similis]
MHEAKYNNVFSYNISRENLRNSSCTSNIWYWALVAGTSIRLLVFSSLRLIADDSAHCRPRVLSVCNTCKCKKRLEKTNRERSYPNSLY